jgi:hypothetical protein
MTNDEFVERTRARILERQADELAQLQERHATELTALDILAPTLLESVNARVQSDDAPPKNVRLRKLIKQIVPDLLGSFNINTVIGRLQQLNPELTNINPTSVSGALKKLALPGGPIELVERGKGKRPSTYKNRVEEKASLELAS